MIVTGVHLLPDGRALVVGGSQSDGWNPACAVHATELWDPQTETWTTMASMERPRGYHATALLLPDGRLLVAGGENSDIGGGEPSAEIYSPPYLFRGARPEVDFAPGHIGYGDTFTVDSPDASSIDKVSIIRSSSVTHAFDENTRYLSLVFGAAGTALTVEAPAHGNLAPPGYYMLFLVNDQGLPSIAEWVKLGDCTATQNVESSCEDGVDNDCDTLPDAADTDCPSGLGEFAPAGAVPDGGRISGDPLLLAKAGQHQIKLEWGASCDEGDQDYAIYEGVIGEYGDHIPVVCSTNGATTWTFGRMGSHYYLVVPSNGLREGSYGVDHEGERPASTLGCLPQEIGACR